MNILKTHNLTVYTRRWYDGDEIAAIAASIGAEPGDVVGAYEEGCFGANIVDAVRARGFVIVSQFMSAVVMRSPEN